MPTRPGEHRLPEGENLDGLREDRIREASLGAITQPTVVAKFNRASKAKTTTDASRLYRVGDPIDFHRPPATKDEHGGWHGPYKVIRNDAKTGRLVCSNGSKEIYVRYPDARHTLFVEAIFATITQAETHAADAVIDCIRQL